MPERVSRKRVPVVLNAVADKVLAYKPKPKSVAAEMRERWRQSGLPFVKCRTCSHARRAHRNGPCRKCECRRFLRPVEGAD